MEEAPIQILEVRADQPGLDPSITLLVSAEASGALLVALSEQLDRRRIERLEAAEDVQELRQARELVERIESLAAAQAHAVVRFAPEELRSCLLELTSYADRMEVDGFQPPDVRERLQVIARITPVLWDANAASCARPPAASIAP
jgi:predicted RecB family endonuclease